MAGAAKVLDSVTALLATTTNQIDAGAGGHRSATFLVNVTAITGTWAVEVKIEIEGLTPPVATRTGITATGLYRLTVTSGLVDFDTEPDAIPEPSQVTWTETATGGITATVYAFYGD